MSDWQGQPAGTRWIVGVSGASGAPYARRLLELLAVRGCPVEVIVTRAGAALLAEELGVVVLPEDPLPGVESMIGRRLEGSHGHAWNDVGASISSGSYPVRGMVVCPCSGGALGAIAAGISSDLLQRAADVQLKERRTLLLVTRETPLSAIHLENMLRVTRAGAVVMPASPGFYHRPTEVDDLIDFVVHRILDQMGLPDAAAPRWRAEPE